MQLFAFFKELDLFGETVPTFNMGGKTEIKTFPGALFSITIVYLTIMFGTLKIQHLVERKNPQIVTNTQPLEAGYKYPTTGDDFMTAYAAENYDTGKGISDPRYIRWVTAYVQRINDEWVTKWYPMYKCQEKDLARFATPDSVTTKEKVKRLQDGGHFFCIDWTTMKFDLYGAEAQAVDFAVVDVSLIACASRITLFDGSVVGGDEDCIWDQPKMEEIMNMSYNFIVYHNQHEFLDNEFDEDRRIDNYSTLQATFSTTFDPRWTLSPIELNRLIDETGLFQLG